jgi:hypothetical protein
MLKYYEDLSLYEYYMHSPTSEVRNVGWLDEAHEFTTGEVTPELLEKLEELILNSHKSSCNILVNKLRGQHKCPICGVRGLAIGDERTGFILGSSELWIPDNKHEGHCFATFGLIIHYIKDHHYRPPQDFIDAVLELDPNIEFDGQAVRDALSEKYYLLTQNS